MEFACSPMAAWVPSEDSQFKDFQAVRVNVSDVQDGQR